MVAAESVNIFVLLYKAFHEMSHAVEGAHELSWLIRTQIFDQSCWRQNKACMCSIWNITRTSFINRFLSLNLNKTNCVWDIIAYLSSFERPVDAIRCRIQHRLNVLHSFSWWNAYKKPNFPWLCRLNQAELNSWHISDVSFNDHWG